MKNILKKAIAECIGTCVLVFVACGVAVFTGGSLVPTSLAFGLVIVAMAYSIGNISGCHINPAVSLAMYLSKRMTLKDCLIYVGAQVVGALVGSLLLGLCLRADFSALGGNEIADWLYNGSNKMDFGTVVIPFLVEVVLTFIFVITILGVTDSEYHEGKQAGLVIGGALTLVHLIGIVFTGTSVNPARSLAPALLQAFAGETTSLSQIWIWLLAPLAGGALAALVYNLSKKAKAEKEA